MSYIKNYYHDELISNYDFHGDEPYLEESLDDLDRAEYAKIPEEYN